MSNEPTEAPIEYAETKEEVRWDAIVGSIIICVIVFIVFMSFFYVKYVLHTFKDSIFSRFEKFTELSFSKISLTLIIAFLVSEVVSGFNVSIMVPLIQAMFPQEDLWRKPIHITRGAVMYPGLFFQALLSFIMSIILLFMIGEMVYRFILFSRKTKRRKLIVKYSFIGIIVALVLALIGWNVYDIVKPKPVPLPSPTSEAQNEYNNPFSVRFFF